MKFQFTYKLSECNYMYDYIQGRTQDFKLPLFAPPLPLLDQLQMGQFQTLAFLAQRKCNPKKLERDGD